MRFILADLKTGLGILPAAETTALYEAIKANRLPPPPSGAAPEDSPVERRNLSQSLRQQRAETEGPASTPPEPSLPAQPTPFIGRQQEVAAVCGLLTQETPPVRLITLTGTGGAGKTRLALQVAAELQDSFADGLFFVPLASLSDPQLLASTIAQTLAISQRLNLWWILADSLINLGNVALALGDYVTARSRLEQAAALAKSNNEVWLVANVLNNLGETARIQGNYEQARCNYEESQILFRTMETWSDVARSLHNLGYVAQHQGDYQQAEANFREGLRMFQVFQIRFLAI